MMSPASRASSRNGSRSSRLSSNRYNTIHRRGFAKMDSIESHYAALKSRKAQRKVEYSEEEDDSVCKENKTPPMSSSMSTNKHNFKVDSPAKRMSKTTPSSAAKRRRINMQGGLLELSNHNEIRKSQAELVQRLGHCNSNNNSSNSSSSNNNNNSNQRNMKPPTTISKNSSSSSLPKSLSSSTLSQSSKPLHSVTSSSTTITKRPTKITTNQVASTEKLKPSHEQKISSQSRLLLKRQNSINNLRLGNRSISVSNISSNLERKQKIPELRSSSSKTILRSPSLNTIRSTNSIISTTTTTTGKQSQSSIPLPKSRIPKSVTTVNFRSTSL